MAAIDLNELKVLLKEEFEKKIIIYSGVATEQTTLDSINREQLGPEFAKVSKLLQQFKGKDILFKYRPDDDFIHYEFYDFTSHKLLADHKTTRGIEAVGSFELWFIYLDDLQLKQKGVKYEGENTARINYEYNLKTSLFFCTLPLRVMSLQGVN